MSHILRPKRANVFHLGMALVASFAAVMLVIAFPASGIFARTLSEVVATGGITGTVVGAHNGEPLGYRIKVTAYDAMTDGPVGFTYASANGQYQLKTLSSGNYKIEFTDAISEYVRVFYDSQPTLSAATLVQVTTDTVTANINAALMPIAGLQGTVVDETTGIPIRGVNVTAYRRTADDEQQFAGNATTDSEGRYVLAPLKPDNYTLWFSAGFASDFLGEWYEDVADSSADRARVIALAGNGSVVTADVALARRNGAPHLAIGQLGGTVNAWTSQSASNLLLAAQGPRLKIFSTSSLNNPRLIGQTELLTSTAADVAVRGQYAYLANEQAGLRVFDISEPSSPRAVSALAVPGSARSIAIYGDFALVGSNFQGLSVVSITDPTRPISVAHLPIAGTIERITISGTRAYLANTTVGVQVIEIGALPALNIVGVISNLGGVHRLALQSDSLYAIASNQFMTSGLYTFNTNSLALTSRYTQTYMLDVAVHGNRLYVPTYSGISYFDISNPAQPQFVREDYEKLSFDRIYITDATAIGLNRASQLQMIGLEQERFYELGATPLFVSADYVATHGSTAFLLKVNQPQMDVVSVANPNQPTFVGQLAAPHNLNSFFFRNYFVDVATVGNRLYALSGFELGLSTWDIANPTSPVPTGNFFSSVYQSPRALAVSPMGLAIVGLQKTLVAFDVASTTQIRAVGALTLTEDIIGLNMQGSTAYAQTASALHILNVNTAGAPTIISTVALSSSAAVPRAALHFPFLYYFDRTGLHVLDVRNPQTPIKRGQLNAHGFSFGRLFTNGDLLIAPLYDRTQVIDISNPDELQLQDEFISSADTRAAWANAGYIFICDSQKGLQSYWLSSPTVKVLSAAGLVFDAAPDAVKYEFAAGTVQTPAIITHHPLPPYVWPSLSGFIARGPIFEITAIQSGTAVSLLGVPFTVSLSITPTAALNGSATGLFWWDGNSWEETSSITSTISTTDEDTLRAITQRFGKYAVLQSARGLFLPIVLRNAISSQPDLRIISFEATQSIQSISHTVPLVANRNTLLRVYVESSSAEPINDVTLQVIGTRNGSVLPGSPLRINRWAAFYAASRGAFGRSFNLMLPASWTAALAPVQLALQVDPDNAIPETNENNNAAAATVTFNAVPKLFVKLVPIQYTHKPTGQVVAALTATEWARKALLEMYPLSEVEVTSRVPVNFVGDLSQINELGRLLDVTAALKRGDGAPATVVYYAVIPSGQFRMPFAGLGFIGERISIGVADDQTFLHEVGHNFGLLHAPCGLTGADPKYPYLDGSIGEFGFSLVSNQIHSPALVKDVMSYCHPAWFSDYNTIKLFNDQRTKGAVVQAAAQPGLLVRVYAGGGNAASLGAVYPVHTSLTPLPPNSQDQIELLDANAALIARHPIQLTEVMDSGDNPLWMAQAVVPFPDQPIVTVRFLRNGQPTFTQPMRDFASQHVLQSNQPDSLLIVPILVQDGEAQVLRWGARDTPALVRLSEDAGQTWTTLGVDVLDGELALPNLSLMVGDDLWFEVTLANTREVVKRELRIRNTFVTTQRKLGN